MAPPWGSSRAHRSAQASPHPTHSGGQRRTGAAAGPRQEVGLRRPLSCPIPTRGTNKTPGSPWYTTPTPPLPWRHLRGHTSTSGTSGTTRGTARPGNNSPQRGHPQRGLGTPPLPPGRRPPVDGSAPGCIYPQLPPPGVGSGSHAAPGHGPVHSAPIRPPHVPAPTSGGTLLPSVQWCGHVALRHLVARGSSALRASV